MINQGRIIIIIYSTEVLNSNLCNYNHVYILVRGDISIICRNLLTEVACKNCAPMIKCITKIDGAAIDGAGDLDVVMLIYNLLEYSPNYSDTTGSFWFLF